MQPRTQCALILSVGLLGGLSPWETGMAQVPPPLEQSRQQQTEPRQQPLPRQQPPRGEPEEEPEQEPQRQPLPQEDRDTPQRDQQRLPPQGEQRVPAGQGASRAGNPGLFNYTHLTVLGGDQQFSAEDDTEGDLLGISGGIQLGDAAFAQLEWHEADYEELGERRLTELGIGFQEAYSERSSWFFAIGYLRDDWSATDLEREDFTWLRGRYGFRWRVTDYIEFDLSAVYSRPAGSSDGSSEWGADAGISAYLGDRVALQLRGRDLEGIAPSTTLGIRVEFDAP